MQQVQQLLKLTKATYVET